jgi:hypothetical protein
VPDIESALSAIEHTSSGLWTKVTPEDSLMLVIDGNVFTTTTLIGQTWDQAGLVNLFPASLWCIIGTC